MPETRRRAYPRSRGATSADHRAGALAGGLSPLARGNRDLGRQLSVSWGPIPARAGQPMARSPSAWLGRAYPRSRGATVLPMASASSSWGLSPLARGNRRRAPRRSPRAGPIPARAGQPLGAALVDGLKKAYPRSRGATLVPAPMSRYASGLSPLARGNLIQEPSFSRKPGPIPARAGQPGRASQTGRFRWAYPRSRGATVIWFANWPAMAGLSPLARGNHHDHRADAH